MRSCAIIQLTWRWFNNRIIVPYSVPFTDVWLPAVISIGIVDLVLYCCQLNLIQRLNHYWTTIWNDLVTISFIDLCLGKCKYFSFFLNTRFSSLLEDRTYVNANTLLGTLIKILIISMYFFSVYYQGINHLFHTAYIFVLKMLSLNWKATNFY